MTVDLHRQDGEPTSGIVTLRNGDIFFSLIVGQDEDGDYEVRYEDGWYVGLTRDGLRCKIGVVDGRKRWIRNPAAGESPFDVVGFERAEHMPEGMRYGYC